MNQELQKTLHNAATNIRLGALEGVYNASSGHPGGSLSIAEILAYLYFNEMHIDPKNPKYLNELQKNLSSLQRLVRRTLKRNSTRRKIEKKIRIQLQRLNRLRKR